MKCRTVAGAAITLMVVLSPSLYGEVRTGSGLQVTSGSDGKTTFARLSLPSLELVPNGFIAFAQVSLGTQSESGVDVDIWEDPGTGVLPWTLPLLYKPISRAVTGLDGTLSIDVSELIRLWAASKKSGAVLIRVIPGQNTEDALVLSNVGARLTYHEIRRQ